MKSEVYDLGSGYRVKPTAREREREKKPREVEPFSNKSCVVVRDETAACSSFPFIYDSATTAKNAHWIFIYISGD